MKITNCKELLKFFIIGGIISEFIVWVLILYETICDYSHGMCILYLFLIQSPAAYFSSVIEYIFRIELSSIQLSWIFRVVISLFWFIVGALIGLVIYFIKKSGKLKNLSKISYFFLILVAILILILFLFFIGVLSIFS